MRAPISKFLSRSTGFLCRTTPLSTGVRHLCATTVSPEDRTKKLERIADDLLNLNRIELYDYSILFSHKLGLNRYGSAAPLAAGSAGDANASGGGSMETKTAEKTAFDVKLEKFEAASKIKVIKEIRGFTDLGLKEAKELVEKAPCVVKKGVTKEEADQIMEKLKSSLFMEQFIRECDNLMLLRHCGNFSAFVLESFDVNFSIDKKVPGQSWIEVKDKIHVFYVEDVRHPEMDSIHTVLHNLLSEMLDKCNPQHNRRLQFTHETG